MKRSRIHILNLIPLLLLVGCLSGRLSPQGQSPLEGTWRETAVQCLNESTNALDEQINSALKSGQVSVLLKVRSSRAVTSMKTWVTPDHGVGEGRGACEIQLEQNWNLIGDHVEVADLNSQQNGVDGNRCSGRLETHSPRIHAYKLLGDRLVVYMNSTIEFNAETHLTSIRPSHCSAGSPQMISFERIAF